MPAFSKIHIVYLTFLYFTALLPHSAFALQVSTQTQLAKVYEENTNIPISDYLVSEKYDGIRALWTGDQLLTRQGNQISAPEWFTAPLPGIWLDGELWTKRQNFEDLSSIVRTQIPEEERWREVQYMVFDMPDAQLSFEKRYKNYSTLIKQINAEHIKPVKQQRFHSNHELSKHLQTMVRKGAEGLMLHLATAPHQSGRSDALLKLKPYFDDEAEVIAHLPGKGKYTGMLGALRVRNQQGIEFSIGTGFTDAERANPPPVGSIITYKYHGYTNNGVPRFASFLRIREKTEDE
jgi:DNA ligase-1